MLDTLPISKGRKRARDESHAYNGVVGESAIILNGGLQQVIKDETSSTSPFEEVTLALRVSLLPASLKDIFGAIRANVYELLMRYNEAVGGVVLALNKIEFPPGEKHGRIYAEMPHIHFAISAQAQVFRPLPNTILRGAVTSVSSSHVGMLVYGIFNASLSSPELVRVGYSYSQLLNQWERKAEAMEDVIAMGTVITFAVSKLHQAQGLISIDGAMLDEARGEAVSTDLSFAPPAIEKGEEKVHKKVKSSHKSKKKSKPE